MSAESNTPLETPTMNFRARRPTLANIELQPIPETKREVEGTATWEFQDPADLEAHAKAAAYHAPVPPETRRSTLLRREASTFFTKTYEYVSNHKMCKSRHDYSWRTVTRGMWSRVSKFGVTLPVPLQILLCILHVLCEILIIVIYIEVQSRDVKSLTFQKHDDNTNYFFIKLGTSIFFLLMWMAHVGTISRFVSTYTLITFVTCLWQIVLAFLWWSVDDVRFYYTPMFIRCWVLRIYVKRLFSFYHFTDPVFAVYRNIFQAILFVACWMYTLMGIYRIVETFQGHFITLNECWYLMVVTFATVGFGDRTPSTRWGRTVIIATVFVATAILPVFLTKLQEGAAAVRALNKFTLNSRHLIVVGQCTFKEVFMFLHDIVTHSPTRCIVFVSDFPFSERILALQSHPLYRNRVCFIVGDVTSRWTMARCRAERAEAIFLLSDKHAATCRGDYNVMRNSVAIRRLEPRLPQYLWLKYGTHDFMLRSVFTAIHRERLKKTIGGMALINPGVIPLLVNLFSTFVVPPRDVPDEIFSSEHSDDWRRLYRYSRSNEVFVMRPQWPLDGVTFEKAVVMLRRRFRITPVAIGVRSDVSLMINPIGTRISAKEHVLLVIARTHDTVLQAEAELGEEQLVDVTSMGEAIRSDDAAGAFAGATEPFSTQEEADRDINASIARSLTAPIFGLTTIAGASGFGGASPAFAGAPSFCGSMTMSDFGTIIEADAPDHFLFIDQTTAIALGDPTEHEVELNDRLRSEDLLLMMQTAKSLRPNASTWLVSLVPPSDDFRAEWRDHGHDEVVHIYGSALKEEPLLAGRAVLAKGIYVYSSAQSKKEFEDAPLFSVDRNIRWILRDAGDVTVNVVIEAHSLSACKFLEPQHKDPEWSRASEEDFQLSMSFMMGKTIAADMFQSLLIQSFYCPLIIKLLNQLLYIPTEIVGGDDPYYSPHTIKNTTFSYAKQREFIQEMNVRIGAIYNDQIRFRLYKDALRGLLAKLQVVVVGVFRLMPPENDSGWTSERPRYFITNPDDSMPLYPTDIIYFFR